MQGCDQLPWEEIADAYDAVREAERRGDMDGMDAAIRWKRECQEKCAAIGTFLLFMALTHGNSSVKKMIADQFGSLASAAWEKAQRASRRAKAALADLDAVTQRLKELERRIDNLTPGIGVPEWDVTQAVGVAKKVAELAGRIRILESKQGK